MVKKKEKEDFNCIADVLKKKNISQYRLHKDSGISYALINGYCKNKLQPGLKQLFLIANVLGVSVCDLINE